MKLIIAIGLAIVPVLATASVIFFSFENGSMRAIRPDKAGWIAFGIVLFGVALQIIKESQDWKQSKVEAEAQTKKEMEARRIANYRLESLCWNVNFILDWMATESKVIHPCYGSPYSSWYYVHSGYRSNLVLNWTGRKTALLQRVDAEQWDNVLGILPSWREQLDNSTAMLDLQDSVTISVYPLIKKVRHAVESNWGQNELTDAQRMDPLFRMKRIQQSLQEIVNAAEFIFPVLRKEEYAQGRQACATMQDRLYPNPSYTDLIFRPVDDQ